MGKWSRKNQYRDESMEIKKIAEKIFIASLKSVKPESLVHGYTDNILSYYALKKFKKMLVAGFGKAAYQMARAFEAAVGAELITDGVIVTKYGHAEDLPAAVSGQQAGLKKIAVYEAGHPIPDENGTRAADKIVGLLRSADESTLVLCLISGGGSALFVSPYEGISLNEKQLITDLLLKAGADISELNAVRKHLSAVKGGRLAEIASPAEMISLMISDVIGDKLDVIASGPTAPDSSSFQDALDVIHKYQLEEKAPASVIDLLSRGVKGAFPDTPKQGNPVFQRVQNIIIGSNRIAIEAAGKEAEAQGFDTRILSTDIEGDAGEAGKRLAEMAIETLEALRAAGNREKTCLISGGETTVIVKGTGKGGRNTELALRFAIEIEGIEGITMISAGTDGTDGPTDAAGAVVDGNTIAGAKALGLDPQKYLDNNDSYSFFKKTGSLIITGPTGTNVMDLQIMIVG